MIKPVPRTTTLIRYGRVPEVARFDIDPELCLDRGDGVIVETHRGLQVGEFLELVPDTANLDEVVRPSVVRKATAEDLRAEAANRTRADRAFADWCDRIENWDLDLQLLDLEWTLDAAKLILYVLNERGPDCTRLALQAVAAGFGVIEVQPVDEGGVVQSPDTGGGCGSGGCGSGGCG